MSAGRLRFKNKEAEDSGAISSLTKQIANSRAVFKSEINSPIRIDFSTTFPTNFGLHIHILNSNL
jgi:hypothetical protein